ncbi:MAG: CoA transferase [Pseudonocardiaceae bacterium]
MCSCTTGHRAGPRGWSSTPGSSPPCARGWSTPTPSGWGDALGDQPPLGADFMVQAYSGLAAMVRPADQPPAPSLMTLTDVLGGLICAQGVPAGLIARIRTGSGQRVDSSLLSAATVLRRSALDAAGSSAGRPVWTPLHRPTTGPPMSSASPRCCAGWPTSPERPARISPRCAPS